MRENINWIHLAHNVAQMVSFYEHGDESLYFMKGKKFSGHLSGYQLVRKHSVIFSFSVPFLCHPINHTDVILFVS
jgi:hypothetical protein